MKLDFTGKYVLVTGGTRGIGFATAIKFAKLGATVIITSREASQGKKVEKLLQDYSIGSRWIKSDISKHQDIKSLFSIIEKEYGQLDIAFNNASSGGSSGLLHEYDKEDWEITINGTLNSIFYCMKEELRIMEKMKTGVIINNSSVDGLRGFPYDVAYSAAKHGVIGLTKSSAIQYAQRNIRIVAIAPGWINTDLVKRILEDEEVNNQMEMHQPLGRLGTPEEVANYVVFLSSKYASFAIGINPIDGGYTSI